jgi:hypothetical protein
MKVQWVQTLFSKFGEGMCYALCIIELYRKRREDLGFGKGEDIDYFSLIIKAIDKGYIYFNYYDPDDPVNCFVNFPGKMFSWLTGEEWTVLNVKDASSFMDGDLIVERWERKTTGSVIGHFRLAEWDPLYNSRTVRDGSIASYRVFRRA